MRFAPGIVVGVLLMALAFEQHGWWGFVYLPLACVIMGCVQAAYEYGG